MSAPAMPSTPSRMSTARSSGERAASVRRTNNCSGVSDGLTTAGTASSGTSSGAATRWRIRRRAVLADAAQPGREGARGAQRAEGAKGVEEGILGEVARLLGVANLAGEGGEDGRVVPPGQLIGRARRAGEDSGDQVRVGARRALLVLVRHAPPSPCVPPWPHRRARTP